MATPSLRHLLTAVCLLASLGLVFVTVRSALSFESVHLPSGTTAFADPAEAASRQAELAGTYVTGDRTGDRRITITADGRIEFSEVGQPPGHPVMADTFTLGRRGKQVCLVPREGDVVEVVNLSTLVYYRDTYRRK